MTSYDGVSIFTSLRYDPILLTSPENTALSGNGDASPFYMLSYHSDRLLAAASHFSFSPAARALGELEPLRSRLQQELASYHRNSTQSDASSTSPSTPLKVRIEIFNTSAQGPHATVQFAPLPAVELSTLYPSHMPSPTPCAQWKAVVDPQATEQSEFTRWKTSKRAHYDAARERAGISGYKEPKEVVMWNGDGEVMEASIAAVFVRRRKDGEWWAMRDAAGGLGSTVKKWLLRKGLVRCDETEEGAVRREEVRSGDWVVLGNGARGVWGAWVV